MSSILVVLIALPFVVAVATIFLPVGISKILTVITGAVTFALALALVPTAATHTQIATGSLLRVDALSVVFLVATTFLYGATAVFAGGYLHLADSPAGTRYGRRFYAGLNLFCWSMVAAPLVNGLALLWVAIEITTVISALLVAIDDTDGATEASWKYVLIASLGLGIALLATIIMYYAGTRVFGSAYDLSYAKLLAGAGRFPPDVVRLAFVLAVLGFGTKMGLVPVHTWLPDAHSEAPTPVSALLSGSLLAISFYAILRYFQIAVRTLGPTFPRNVLLIFGLASLLLAALYLLSQRDLKRLLAYSSVEHMGILAIGMSFGAPIAVVGVLLHVLAHAAAKGTAFFGAGSVVRKFGTKDMTKIRGGIGALPWSGPMLVAAVLALSAMPPFGIFRSEFLIVSGGLSGSGDTVAAILVVLVTLAFFGLSWFTTQTMLTPDVTAVPADGTGVVTPAKGEVSAWIVVAMALGLVALVILGVHPPAQLSQLLNHAASELGAPPVTGDRSAVSPSADAFAERVTARVEGGGRFCGLFGCAAPNGTRLLAILAVDGSLDTEAVLVPDGGTFPSLSPRLPAASWYEREVHDLFGLAAVGHPRLDPLVLPLSPGAARPRPGSGKPLDPVEIDPSPLPAHLQGEGVFTISYGPVRSGVFESIEYLVETPGEDIPHLRARVFYKHRGVEIRFEGMDISDGVLLAERCEGVASVAHAIAYCGAIERMAGVDIPPAAGLVRVVHAELERIANHLDSVVRHTEAAGQAVAYARLTLHKERVQRLRARLCGSRFGRGVVVPGGVAGPLRLDASQLFAALEEIEHGTRADLRLLMATPSFLDRLRGTGVVPPELARSYAAVGPVGRGSGQMEDVRFARPYAAYQRLGHQLLEDKGDGDALARQRVRIDEITGAFHLIRQAIDRLSEATGASHTWGVPVERVSGETLGWAEAPQGEVLYLVRVEDGRLVRVKPRSASFHNLALFHAAFPKDILTDFAFIEASFGLSIAGAAS